MKKAVFIKNNIPSLITLLNLVCGFLSLVFVLKGDFQLSAVLILLSCVFDILDGLVARMFNLTSQFGVELDSLADAVSFVIAPAILVYVGLLQMSTAGLIVAISITVTGIIRLAKFNTIDYKKSFIGLPTPGVAMVVALFVLSGIILIPNLTAAIFFVLALLMVSPLKIPNLKGRIFLRYKIIGSCIFGIVIVALIFGLDHFYISIIEHASVWIFMIIPLLLGKLVKRKNYMLLFMAGLIILTILSYKSASFLLVLLPFYTAVASPLVQLSFEEVKKR